MAVNIQQADITAWQDFFGDGEVQVKQPVITASTSDSSLLAVKCENNRFGGSAFGSGQNGKPLWVQQSVLMTLVSADQSLSNIAMGKIFSMAGFSEQQQTQSTQRPNLFMKIVSAISSEFIFSVDQTDPRNAMWLTPGNTMRIDTALTFVPSTNPDSQGIFQALKELGIQSSLKIPSLSLKVQRTCRGVNLTTQASENEPPKSVWAITSSWQLTFRIPAAGLIFWIKLEPLGMTVSVTGDPATDPSQLWDSMRGLGLANLDVKDASPTDQSAPGSIGDILSNTFQFLQLRVVLDAQGTVNWKVTIMISLKSEDQGTQAVDLFLTYNSLSKTFSGGLITAGFFATDALRLLPDYSPADSIDMPSNKGPYLPYWDLKQYFSKDHQAAIPKGLPLAIRYANVALATQAQRTLFLAGRAINIDANQSRLTTGGGAEVTVTTPFVWDSLDVSFSTSRADGKSATTCSLSSHFTLNPPAGLAEQAADMALTIGYNNGDWLLAGYVENLSCGLLYSFFDKDSGPGVLDIIGGLKIASLGLILTHNKNGGPASFLFTGIIDLGQLELRLFFQYTSESVVNNKPIESALKDAQRPPPLKVTAGQSWVFECDLGASTGDATIGTIANSILNNASTDLPSFIADIKIPKADGANGRAPVYLKATKVDNLILFVFRFALGPFTMTFAQAAPAGPPDPGQKPATKRLLRFAVGKIPPIEAIPLLNTLPQPFDQMEYVWVSQGGFNKVEVDAINDKLLSGVDRLMYKQVTSSDPTSKDLPSTASGNSERPKPTADPPVLAPGHHFIIIQNDAVVVDHIFHTSSPPQKATATPAQRKMRALALEATPSPPPAEPSPPSKGTMAFKLGPLSIDGIGLQFKEQGGSKSLVITMNATFAMGPISFSLLGFGIGISLDGLTLDDLSMLIKDIDKNAGKTIDKIGKNIFVTLAGLALSFNKPPILIAGGFEHAVIPLPGTPGATQDVFMGGIGVSFPPYTFIGLGEYAIVTINGQDYKSVFLFCRLDGPLIDLELAIISGIRLGLGYNSAVRAPSNDEITSFPFINDGKMNNTGSDPMAILKTMTDGATPWVVPKLDSYWFAVGMSITAFDLLTVTAVAMLAFRDSGLIASIYADAVVQMPPDVPKEAVIVYAEIGLVAEMNFVDGYFRVEAALAPTSYLLVPQCHLYGGFALVYWFPPSDHSGDWVFTIGGYHRSYTPPAWYPVPRRLGISFNIDIISITGEAYFAITPKCVMGGALLHASLAFGPIHAWYDAAFDCLIQFHPFHYIADFSITVGVSFDVDFLFVHIHIGGDVSAQLHIWGPEFGGTAYVDFRVMGFDIDFGASPKDPDPLNLEQFWTSLHKPGPESGDNSKRHDAPLQSHLEYTTISQDLTHIKTTISEDVPGAALKYSLESGNFPMPSQPDTSSSAPPTSTGAGQGWHVKGGSFAFRISTDFAVSDTSLELSDETYQEARKAAIANKQDPDKVSHLRTSMSTSKIYSKPMHVGQVKDITSTLAVTVVRKVVGKADEVIDNFSSVTLATKPVPTAIWEAYDPHLDPKKKPASLLNGDNATVPQSMAVAFGRPLPTLSPPVSLDGHGFFIPKFKATAAMRFGVLDFRTTAQKFGGIHGDALNGTDWYVPASQPKQEQYLPRPLTLEEKEKEKERNETNNAVRWADTRSYWSGLADKAGLVNGTVETETAGLGLLTVVAQTLAWDQKRPQTEIVFPEPVPDPASRGRQRQPWELSGSLPAKMIRNLEGMYLDLPRVAVVAA